MQLADAKERPAVDPDEDEKRVGAAHDGELRCVPPGDVYAGEL
jgi:hypothetical protein